MLDEGGTSVVVVVDDSSALTEGDAASTSQTNLLYASIHRQYHAVPPAHHVVSKPELRRFSSITSLFSLSEREVERSDTLEGHTTPFETGTSTNTTNDTSPLLSLADTESSEYIRTGFRNPWPSWHKPRLDEVWNGLRWTKRPEQMCDDAADGDTPSSSSKGDLSHCEAPKPAISSPEVKHMSEDDLQIIEPDFADPNGDVVQATWLGHATLLLRLPPLQPSDPSCPPRRILFDPIFSMRCSPTQYFGPIRLFPPPCSIASLPDIDVVVISHSHYDHLDYDSIVQLWNRNHEHLRFVVPLGVKEWFLALNIGILEERVTELDWWDKVCLTEKPQSGASEHMLRMICTPAQHGSGRYGLDASRSLWSSWTIEHISQASTFRTFFGGDTGFQFHSPDSEASVYPTCPAFAEVCTHIGKPDLSFLPISVGASFNFIKSYDMLGVVPEVDHGLTAANHLTPHDAVRVAKILRGRKEKDDKTEEASIGGVALAIHWGTFLATLEEAADSMKDLRIACERLGVEYITALDERTGDKRLDSLKFACINHGQSIYLAIRPRRENPEHS